MTRQENILALIEQKGYVTVGEICAHFYISEPTARRDLSSLERSGAIRRSRGGAMPASGGILHTVEMRNATMRDSKRKIARAAAELVSDGDMIFIDTSTTAHCIIPHLKSKTDVTVVTNSIPALELLKNYGIPAKSTGGDLNPVSMGLVGYHAEQFVKTVRADIMFFSTPCIDTNGIISDRSEMETYLRRTLLDNSCQSVYLFDATKLGKSAPYLVADVRNVNVIISDADLTLFDTPAKLITV